MVFSAPIFLFGFLPLALLGYYLTPRGVKNTFLLLASLLFYAWGEVFFVLVMLASIAANYTFGLMIGRSEAPSDLARRKLALVLGIGVNLALLGTFKYSNFIVDNLNVLLAAASIAAVDLNPVHLPLGISFFTFQAMSYLVDVYRRETPHQSSALNLALYISLFPQLIAGPIVRYHNIADQITRRTHSISTFSEGAQRFTYGLAKKVLIADPLAEVADSVFALPPDQMSTQLVWLGIISYTLQIYFDFSGYSDMAIGLGRMFGFRFLENFNYPYIAASIQDFWRRWHISLSTWFRDYLYIPLGGNKRPPIRVFLNLLTVFLLCGLWHGAAWNFILWGLWHGGFLVIERGVFGRVLTTLWQPMRHVYTLLIVIIGWVLFRADSLPYALDYLHAMFVYTPAVSAAPPVQLLVSIEYALALAMGVVLSTPVFIYCQEKARQGLGQSSALFQLQRTVVFAGLFALAALKMSASTYSPFIYFRF